MSPHTDLAAHARWQHSLRRSRERRAAAFRRRRRRLRGRGLAIALAVSMLVMTGVALAATSNGGSATTLKSGSTGAAVKQLQRKLHVRASGRYDAATKRAVKRFQATHGLTADGVAGAATLDALGIDVRAASSGTGGTTADSGSGSGGSNVKLPPALKRIAQCESGGDPHAVSPSGRYRGKYQFDKATWQAAGGSGDPAKAPEATQDRIALALYKKRGTAPWPNCG